ncbi:hypothetical protein L916_11289 [Phytophthora nicotianae]|uniref:Tc1-like transposase DDE domain-containing protein n=1 Tax=Phytophthora nicotianae TaxID=4792 RepID=W2IRT5_PHYNI|nr:hypothetical protein L916_11289 [Phytophthora nicotianae]
MRERAGAHGCQLHTKETKRPKSRLGAYLANKVSNLSARLHPKVTEVFLDESYCNVNHTAGSSWVVKHSPRYVANGAGQRYCIVGAGSVFVKNGGLCAEWVHGSIKRWPSHLKGDGDYHSNFTGELFELWFEELCQLLQSRYGRCRIHMDGAAYHKVIEDPAPASSKTKAVMVKWLNEHGVTVGVNDYTKKQLEQLIAQPTNVRVFALLTRQNHQLPTVP